MEHKWVCIQCGEKEIPQYAEYCDECAEKRMSRIGGWLWLPLITLFLSLGAGGYTLSGMIYISKMRGIFLTAYCRSCILILLLPY